MRIGHGYDVHRLCEGRALILGGVNIPFGRGLLGHSDADVLCHACMDALLGAGGLGDIGRHFPDSSKEFFGISSLELMGRVAAILKERRLRVINIDATLIAQAPKLAEHLPQMCLNLAGALGIEPGMLNVKATTEEGLGFTGIGEGIAAHAVALLEGI